MMNFNDNSSSLGGTIRSILDRVEKDNNVKAVFGEPVREQDITVIPVAATEMNGDRDDCPDESGAENKEEKGGGSGFGYKKKNKPLGYIEIKNGEAKFVPIPGNNSITVKVILIFATLALFIFSFLKSRRR